MNRKIVRQTNRQTDRERERERGRGGISDTLTISTIREMQGSLTLHLQLVKGELNPKNDVFLSKS